MRNILAIVERELRAYFSSPVAYVVLTIFVFLSGLFFQTILNQVLQFAMMQSMQGAQMGRGASPIDMPGIISQNFLQTMSVILLFMLPMLTMGLFSEEKKRGTIELLLTAPITDMQVVLGKFLAAVLFYVLLFATTLVELAILFMYSKPAIGPIVTGYLGVLLYGFAFLAIGMFISSLTENQIIASILTFAVILMLWLVDSLSRTMGPTMGAIFSYLSVFEHLNDFLTGVISTSHIIFYVSLTLVGLFLTYRSLDSLRWRG